MFGFSNMKLITPIMRYHTSKVLFDKIVIPERIHRGPTDILKALAGTIQKDRTRAAYQFHDDPYLTPMTRTQKKIYSFSKESGKAAARFIRDKHGDLLAHQTDDPVIKEFLPKPYLDDETEIEASEDLLLSFIEQAQVTNAIKIYNECKIEDLSQSTLQKLLECICFSNAKDMIDPIRIEEFLISETDILPSAKTWKDNGIAEEIFGHLDTGSKPYCALIRGMCKYNQVERSWELYQEALINDIPLDSSTISHLIQITPRLREDIADRWILVQEIVEKMDKTKTTPSLSIMNSMLAVLCSHILWYKASDISLQILAEFKNLGIEPSLETFLYVIKLFHFPRKKQRTNIISNIIDYFDDREILPRSRYDSFFFCYAMKYCNRDLNDWSLACRIHRLVNIGKNCRFLGNNRNQVVYYQNFLLLALKSLPFEEALKLYDDLCPHVYSPDETLMVEMVKTVAMFDKLEDLPKIWSDILSYTSVALKQSLFELVLMTIQRHDLESASETLKTRLCTITWDIWTKMQGPPRKRDELLQWSPEMLSDCLSILARCEEDQKVNEVLKFIEKKGETSLNDLSTNALESLFNSCSRQNKFDTCFKCLVGLKEKNSKSFKPLISKLQEITTLSEQQMKILQENHTD